MPPAIVFNLNSKTNLYECMVSEMGLLKGFIFMHRFPDGETAMRIETDVKNQACIIIAEMKDPDAWFMPLYYLCSGLKESGASRIVLVLPYLPYMRQDAAFRQGEVVTSKHYAHLISLICDGLITVDPHLHRYNNLGQIYQVPTHVVSAATTISDWIEAHVENAFLIGPDSESRQWVAGVAEKINRPFAVLEKVRQGDRKVEIRFNDFDACKQCTPVVIDDMISTAGTMIHVVHQLKHLGFNNVIAIGVHALFVTDAYENLLAEGVSQVVTCNTLYHTTNMIDVSQRISLALNEFL